MKLYEVRNSLIVCTVAAFCHSVACTSVLTCVVMTEQVSLTKNYQTLRSHCGAKSTIFILSS
jgi:hypothetical protein